MSICTFAQPDSIVDMVETGFDRATVDHSAEEYVRFEDGEAIHTNTIEAFWNNVKRGIKGTYVWV